jgi:hypothetical protein
LIPVDEEQISCSLLQRIWLYVGSNFGIRLEYLPNDIVKDLAAVKDVD